MVEKDIEATASSLSNQPFQLEVAGKKFNLKVLMTPPYPEKSK